MNRLVTNNPSFWCTVVLGGIVSVLAFTGCTNSARRWFSRGDKSSDTQIAAKKDPFNDAGERQTASSGRVVRKSDGKRVLQPEDSNRTTKNTRVGTVRLSDRFRNHQVSTTKNTAFKRTRNRGDYGDRTAGSIRTRQDMGDAGTRNRTAIRRQDREVVTSPRIEPPQSNNSAMPFPPSSPNRTVLNKTVPNRTVALRRSSRREPSVPNLDEREQDPFARFASRRVNPPQTGKIKSSRAVTQEKTYKALRNPFGQIASSEKRSAANAGPFDTSLNSGLATLPIPNTTKENLQVGGKPSHRAATAISERSLKTPRQPNHQITQTPSATNRPKPDSSGTASPVVDRSMIIDNTPVKRRRAVLPATQQVKFENRKKRDTEIRIIPKPKTPGEIKKQRVTPADLKRSAGWNRKWNVLQVVAKRRNKAVSGRKLNGRPEWRSLSSPSGTKPNGKNAKPNRSGSGDKPQAPQVPSDAAPAPFPTSADNTTPIPLKTGTSATAQPQRIADANSGLLADEASPGDAGVGDASTGSSIPVMAVFAAILTAVVVLLVIRRRKHAV